MLKYLLIACLVVSLHAHGQTKVRMSEITEVKDTSGQVYPYDTWYQLLLTGFYTLVAENPGKKKTAFILVEVPDAEKELRIASMPKPPETDCFFYDEILEFFYATDLNGNHYKLEELRGKIVVLNFWFIDCIPCRREIPELNKLVEEFGDSSEVVFLGISLDHKKDIERFTRKNTFKYNIVPDGSYLARKYDIYGYPTHVVIDRSGKIKFHTTGLSFSTIYWLKKTIRSLL